MPPKMKFETPMFHPNSKQSLSSVVFILSLKCSGLHMGDRANSSKLIVYPNGEVCISILHPPEDDKYGYESASERWSPVQTPETILLSVISMLSSPNDESPANVEAARMWREDPQAFKKRVRKCVRESLGEE
jgi:ubiquitin-conjugating enzyme E2 G1